MKRLGIGLKRSLGHEGGRQLSALRGLREGLLARLEDQAVAVLDNRDYDSYTRAASITIRVLEELTDNVRGETRLLSDAVATHAAKALN